MDSQRRLNWFRRLALAGALLAAAVVAPYFAIPLLGHVKNYPTLRTPQMDALADYARANTPKDAVFLFPDAGKQVYPGLFRAEAIRSVYVDWKAGGQVNYFHSLAQEWWMRWNKAMSGGIDEFRELGIGYIVMKKENPLPGLAQVYANSAFLVYDIGDGSQRGAP